MITARSGEVKLGKLSGALLIASPNHTDVITASGVLAHTLYYQHVKAMCHEEESIDQLMH